MWLLLCKCVDSADCNEGRSIGLACAHIRNKRSSFLLTPAHHTPAHLLLSVCIAERPTLVVCLHSLQHQRRRHSSSVPSSSCELPRQIANRRRPGVLRSPAQRVRVLRRHPRHYRVLRNHTSIWKQLLQADADPAAVFVSVLDDDNDGCVPWQGLPGVGACHVCCFARRSDHIPDRVYAWVSGHASSGQQGDAVRPAIREWLAVCGAVVSHCFARLACGALSVGWMRLPPTPNTCTRPSLHSPLLSTPLLSICFAGKCLLRYSSAGVAESHVGHAGGRRAHSRAVAGPAAAPMHQHDNRRCRTNSCLLHGVCNPCAVRIAALQLQRRWFQRTAVYCSRV